MQIEMYHSDPHKPLATTLAAAMRQAHHIDINVAFMSQYGVDFLSRHAAHLNLDHLRLIVSVRWPTDLDALATLANRFHSRIWIHLAGQTPEEKGSDRYQLHSKVVRLQNDENVDIFLGSHNWTGLALEGLNLEASVRIRCHPSDQVAIDTLEHVNRSVAESELFQLDRLHLYKMIQAKLHKTVTAGTAEETDDFIPDQRLIIHVEEAENHTSILPVLQVLFAVPKSTTASFITFGQHVDLYLYPKDTLLGRYEPVAPPKRYEGTVTMVNDPNDADVRDREINSFVQNLATPTLYRSTALPPAQANHYQVISRLDLATQQEMPLYHMGSRPRIQREIHFEQLLPTWLADKPQQPSKAYFTPRSYVGGRLTLQVPSHVSEKVPLKIPQRELYIEDPLAKDDKLDLVKGRAIQYVHEEAKPVKAAPWATKYFYVVSHRKK